MFSKATQLYQKSTRHFDGHMSNTVTEPSLYHRPQKQLKHCRLGYIVLCLLMHNLRRQSWLNKCTQMIANTKPVFFIVTISARTTEAHRFRPSISFDTRDFMSRSHSVERALCVMHIPTYLTMRSVCMDILVYKRTRTLCAYNSISHTVTAKRRQYDECALRTSVTAMA